MSDSLPVTTRSIAVHDPNNGHSELSVDVTDAYGLMPVVFHRNGYDIHLSWSEWGEISDHVEYCRGRWPEPDEEETAPADWTYEPCGAMDLGGPETPLPCVLISSHEVAANATHNHCDRLGRRW